MSALTLTFSEREGIQIGPDVRITIVKIGGGEVVLRAEAPRSVAFTRLSRADLLRLAKATPAN